MFQSIAPAMPHGFITVAMSGFGERVKRRREELGMKQPELARASGIKQPTISNIERGRNKGSQYIVELASALKVRPQWLKSGVGQKELKAGEAPAAPMNAEAMAKDAREEILLLLYRGLFSLQQAEFMQDLRAMFEANQVTRKELGQQPLRGVTNEQVRAAFGDAPFHTLGRKARKRKAPKRDLGDAMGDFLDQ